MAKVSTQFSPSRDGFRFPNYFQFKFPFKYSLPFVGSLDLNEIVFGLCGGMCAAALDYFYAGQARPEHERPDTLEQRFFTFLCERQLQSLSIPVLIKIIEWMMLEDAELATRMKRYELPKIRRALDSGHPVILCLIRVQGLNNPTNNHQVLATGYTQARDSKSMTLDLYDPNHPTKEPTITVDWEQPGLRLSQSTGEPLRGIFVIPYKPQKALPQPPARQPVSFSPETGGFLLSWPVDSRVCTQQFAEHPELYRGFGLPGHEGLDLLALDGARIYACADGEVFEAGARKGGHPYGIHVRIRHLHDGQEYQTIYGHLKTTTVKVGEKVVAGQQIGTADSTGNSTGPHLHLTLKKIGARTGKYPADIVDPWPYLQGAVTPAHEPPASPSGLTIYTSSQVNLRAQPSSDSELLTTLPVAEGLAVLGSAEVEKRKIGQQGHWLRVQTASGQSGYVAAWLVSDTRLEGFHPSGLVVYPIGEVNLRSGPGTGFDLLGSFSYLDPLIVLGDPALAGQKIGRQHQWLQVQAQNGQRGFVAAWLVHQTGQLSPATGLTVYPTGMVNIRARPAIDANILSSVVEGDALSVLGEKDQAAALIGQQGQWLNVQTPTKMNGYVAAWLVQSDRTSPPAASANGLSVQPAPADGVNLRAQPTTNAPVVSRAAASETLTAIDADLNAARQRIGQQDQWIYVRKADGTRGWVAAWLLNVKN